MIPKIIHYVWLGKGEKPEIFKRCFDSWKKFCPDWQFMLWDESNVDLDCFPYVREAYDAKKYAFASDVIRLQKLYEFGGIYLDIDVEILKPIDKFLNNYCFAGFEIGGDVAPGLILGTEKENKDFANIIEQYKKEHFKVNDYLNLKTICERFTDYYSNYGLKKKDKFQQLKNITIYPSKVFCPMNYKTRKIKIVQDTYSIHHYNASWIEKQSLGSRIKNRIKYIVKCIIGKKNYEKLKRKYKKDKNSTIDNG